MLCSSANRLLSTFFMARGNSNKRLTPVFGTTVARLVWSKDTSKVMVPARRIRNLGRQVVGDQKLLNLYIFYIINLASRQAA